MAAQLATAPLTRPGTQHVKRPRRMKRRGGLLRAIYQKRLLLFGSAALLAAACRFGAAGQVGDTLKLVRIPAHNHTLNLLSATALRRLGYVSITGSATNQSTRSLDGVEVVVELLDRNDHTVEFDSSALALQPLKPRESSPFLVEMEDHPEAVSYRVRFRKILGAALD